MNDMMRWRYLLLLPLLIPWTQAVAIEEPSYSLVRTYDGFEVRRYAPYIVAETIVDAAPDEAGNKGFRILAGYIFGQNKAAQSIEMTAPVAQTPVTIAMASPVAQSRTAAGFAVQFMMPPVWTLATLPQPNDPRVTLKPMPGRTVAVMRYSGTWSQSSYRAHVQQLEADLAQQGLRWHGEPIWARYDPPWKPWFLRRNEIWLELG